jgi:hypothetical protein
LKASIHLDRSRNPNAELSPASTEPLFSPILSEKRQPALHSGAFIGTVQGGLWDVKLARGLRKTANPGRVTKMRSGLASEFCDMHEFDSS